MKCYLVVRFLVTLNVLRFGPCNAKQYEFEVEPIRAIWKSTNPTNSESTSGLEPTTNSEELRKLCTAATDYAILDLLNPKGVDPVRWESVRIVYANKAKPGDYSDLLWCGTIPEIWIRSGGSANEFVILIQYSEYLDMDPKNYHFDVTTVQHEPIACTYSLAEYEESTKNDPLEKVSGGDALLHICWNAKKRVDVSGARPILRSADVFYGRLFEFQFEGGKKEKIFAIDCPSTPVMYVYFEDSPSNIRVIFVDTGEETLNDFLKTRMTTRSATKACRQEKPSDEIKMEE